MTAPGSDRLAAAVEARLPFAERLFDSIRAETADSVGVTRPAWSSEDAGAARIIAESARDLGLEVGYDLAGNLRCTLPGADRGARGVLTGSHLDSVPTGGHYDGLAGVIAGLVACAAFRDAGVAPGCDVTVAGLRGEESVWYGIAYVGSRLAVGTLPLDELERLRRDDTGRTLAEHMAEVGVDVEALRSTREPVVSSANTRAFLELHIEQGPVLVGEGLPVGIPTTIRGNVRFPYARCTGRYGHSGATPREWRHDAALAVVELLRTLDELWIEREREGVPDTVFTVGRLFTDPAHHAMTKVPGRCDFTLNFGGTTKTFLDECRDRARTLAERIGRERRVEFELGECVGSDPTPLDAHLRAALRDTCTALGLPVREFATVGHDASIFARAGIPSAMVLVRNAHGSHNPDEEMELADFGEGTKVLAAAIAALADRT
ncbi:MAG: Zn-dependent hydrolase [Immundisolibacterales bacterium]|nr:Zn-dependent hydrolase [Immundisolibacterales bacterium]